MFGKALQLVRVHGIDIKVDLSWLVLALFVAWVLAENHFPSLYEGLTAVGYWRMAWIAVAGLFLSIVLHELAHSLVAQAYGIKIKGITLFIFGGIAEMEEEPKKPSAEFWVAIAGPAMSFVLALVFSVTETLLENVAAAREIMIVSGYLGLLNFVLACFNLVPAFPLDGGRVLRAILWRLKGSFAEATQQSARLGKGFGSLLMCLGVVLVIISGFQFGIWWIVIGLFIRQAAVATLDQVEAEQDLKNATVGDYMTENPQAIDADLPVERFISDVAMETYHDIYPILSGEEVVGALETRRAMALETSKRPYVEVRQVMEPLSDDLLVAIDLPAIEALKKMQRSKKSRLLVIDRDNRLRGLLCLRDLMKALAFMRASRQEVDLGSYSS